MLAEKYIEGAKKLRELRALPNATQHKYFSEILLFRCMEFFIPYTPATDQQLLFSSQNNTSQHAVRRYTGVSLQMVLTVQPGQLIFKLKTST